MFAKKYKGKKTLHCVSFTNIVEKEEWKNKPATQPKRGFVTMELLLRAIWQPFWNCHFKWQQGQRPTITGSYPWKHRYAGKERVLREEQDGEEKKSGEFIGGGRMGEEWISGAPSCGRILSLFLSPSLPLTLLSAISAKWLVQTQEDPVGQWKLALG